MFDPTDHNLSLVYGYFDMTVAPSKLEWVELSSNAVAEEGSEMIVGKGGLFWHPGLATGMHQVSQFGRRASFSSNVDYVYNFCSDRPGATLIDISKPDIYYLGAYRYVAVRRVGHFFSKWLRPRSFYMTDTQVPTESAVLKLLIAELENNPAWHAYERQLSMAKQRLAQLTDAPASHMTIMQPC